MHAAAFAIIEAIKTAVSYYETLPHVQRVSNVTSARQGHTAGKYLCNTCYGLLPHVERADWETVCFETADYVIELRYVARDNSETYSATVAVTDGETTVWAD